MKIEAQAPAKKTQKHKVTSVHLRRAGNGFTVQHEVEPMKQSGGLGMRYMPTRENVFTDKDAMMEHVGNLAEQMHGGEDADSGAEASS